MTTPPKTATVDSRWRLRISAPACRLLIVFLLAKRSLASQLLPLSRSLLLCGTSPLALRSPNSLQRLLHHQSSVNGELTLECGRFSRVAVLHGAQRVGGASSCETITAYGTANHIDDESSPKPSRISYRTTNTLNSLGSVLSLRGGVTSPDNAVQTMLKFILASPSLPSPIKKLIEMICQFIENLTGSEILRHVEKNEKKVEAQSKISGMRKEEVHMEEARAGIKKKRRSKRVKDFEEVEMAIAQKRERKIPKGNSPVTSESGKYQETKPLATLMPSDAAVQRKNPTKSKRPNALSQKLLSNKSKSSNPNYRIQRELKEFLSSPPPGLSVKISGKNIRLWIITLSMPENTIYAGETYRLRVQFPNDYPTSPPSVYFLPPTPRHEHVYTNGDICLSLLGKDWRPIMTAQSVAQAIMSILCGAQRKSLPMDNARHAGNKPGKKQDDWVYHDDNC